MIGNRLRWEITIRRQLGQKRDSDTQNQTPNSMREVDAGNSQQSAAVDECLASTRWSTNNVYTRKRMQIVQHQIYIYIKSMKMKSTRTSESNSALEVCALFAADDWWAVSCSRLRLVPLAADAGKNTQKENEEKENSMWVKTDDKSFVSCWSRARAGGVSVSMGQKKMCEYTIGTNLHWHKEFSNREPGISIILLLPNDGSTTQSSDNKEYDVK